MKLNIKLFFVFVIAVSLSVTKVNATIGFTGTSYENEIKYNETKLYGNIDNFTVTVKNISGNDMLYSSSADPNSQYISGVSDFYGKVAVVGGDKKANAYSYNLDTAETSSIEGKSYSNPKVITGDKGTQYAYVACYSYKNIEEINAMDKVQRFKVYYAQQYAIHAITKGIDSVDSSNDDGQFVKEKVNSLISDAKSEAIYQEPEVTFTGGEKDKDVELVKTSDNNYYVLSKFDFNVTGTVTGKIRVTPSGITGTTIYDANGNSEIDRSSELTLKIPVSESSMEVGKEYTYKVDIKIEIPSDHFGAFEYSSSDNSKLMLCADVRATMTYTKHYSVTLKKENTDAQDTYKATINFYYYKNGIATTEKVFDTEVKEGLENGVTYLAEFPDKNGCTIVNKDDGTAGAKSKTFKINGSDINYDVYYYCPVNNELDQTPTTGDALIYVVWIVGMAAIGYSIYYFKTIKRKE